jgi:hypothetical protein
MFGCVPRFEPNALGQCVGGHGQADLIRRWRGQVRHSIEQAQGLKDRPIDADTDRGVACLDSAERAARRKGPISDNPGRQPTTAASVSDVAA